MMSTMSKDALARAIARGEYVVDAHAVAEAMLRRWRRRSAVLVPAQPLDRPAVRVRAGRARSRRATSPSQLTGAAASAAARALAARS